MSELRDYSAIHTEMHYVLKLMYQCLATGNKKEARGMTKRLEGLTKEMQSYLKTEK
jgi:hypothetical protein